MTAPPKLLTDPPERDEKHGVDALSDVLRVIGLTGGVFLDAEFSEPWLISGKVAPEQCSQFMSQPDHVVAFHYVAEGAFTLRLKDGASCRVTAGQVVMLPQNDFHYFGSAAAIAPTEAGELIPVAQSYGVAKVIHGGGGPLTRMVCGYLGGSGQMHSLLESLPAIMQIDLGSVQGGDWIGRTFSYAAQTLAQGDPGSAAIIAKMSEMLFIEAVRRYLAALPPDQPGWLAGLRDPVIGKALSLLHTRMQDEWTSESLAREVNLSRSAFAERFVTLVGTPPMAYLLNWRMQVAMQKLRNSRLSIAQIAFAVGYDSESAFTRAFRREIGMPPGAWRDNQTA